MWTLCPVLGKRLDGVIVRARSLEKVKEKPTSGSFELMAGSPDFPSDTGSKLGLPDGLTLTHGDCEGVFSCPDVTYVGLS